MVFKGGDEVYVDDIRGQFVNDVDGDNVGRRMTLTRSQRTEVTERFALSVR